MLELTGGMTYIVPFMIAAPRLGALRGASARIRLISKGPHNGHQPKKMDDFYHMGTVTHGPHEMFEAIWVWEELGSRPSSDASLARK